MRRPFFRLSDLLPTYCRSLMEERRHLAGMFAAPKRCVRCSCKVGETPALPSGALAEQRKESIFRNRGAHRELSEETLGWGTGLSSTGGDARRSIYLVSMLKPSRTFTSTGSLPRRAGTNFQVERAATTLLVGAPGSSSIFWKSRRTPEVFSWHRMMMRK